MVQPTVSLKRLSYPSSRGQGLENIAASPRRGNCFPRPISCSRESVKAIRRGKRATSLAGSFLPLFSRRELIRELSHREFVHTLRRWKRTAVRVRRTDGGSQLVIQTSGRWCESRKRDLWKREYGEHERGPNYCGQQSGTSKSHREWNYGKCSFCCCLAVIATSYHSCWRNSKHQRRIPAERAG